MKIKLLKSRAIKAVRINEGEILEVGRDIEDWQADLFLSLGHAKTVKNENVPKAQKN